MSDGLPFGLSHVDEALADSLRVGLDDVEIALRKAVTRVARPAPVIGITGTGGAGKSSLTDELLMRFVRFHPGRNIAVIAMDPTRRRSGGALLGDRIRMNALANEQIFMRSLATRRQNLATSAVLADTLNLLKCAGFDLIVVTRPGALMLGAHVVQGNDLNPSHRA